MSKIFAQSIGFFSFFYMISIVIAIGCSDWFLVWLGLEINMMSFIILVYDRSSSSVEACMKYFFIQSLGSGILMLMFYSDFNWVEYVGISVLSYKMGGGPFYFWFPSLCDNMSWGSCYLLMTVQKVLPLTLSTFLVSSFLWVIIVTSITGGAVGSMNQNSVKRLMAYSSIHHIGWMFLGHLISKEMCLIYLLMYSMMILGIVMSLMKDKILDMSSLGMVSSKWSFVLGMLSMGGMPPMLGFYMKWWLFYNLMSVDFSNFMLMVMMSVLMFYVYLRIVYSVLMGSKKIMCWGMVSGNKKSISLDLLYMMGINMGVLTWLIM